MKFITKTNTFYDTDALPGCVFEVNMNGVGDFINTEKEVSFYRIII